MKKRHLAIIGAIAFALLVLSSVALAGTGDAKPAMTLVETVRQATAQYKDVEKASGYALLHGCVSGQQEGAMGIHYANGALVDGTPDAQHPEALLYEPKDGKLQLAGVEYVVIADAWNAHSKTPPVLMGQLFNYVGAPNRYGLPAFYELHVWAWKNNPNGMFADWNPRVSCDDFAGSMATHDSSH